MSLRIFHTPPNLHLGMTFRNRGYPEEVRQQQVESARALKGWGEWWSWPTRCGAGSSW